MLVVHWCANVCSPLADPDLLISDNVTVGGITQLQSRTQFSLWCLFPAPLLISKDITTASPYEMATWGNVEAIAINQDASPRAAFRLQVPPRTAPHPLFPCSAGYRCGCGCGCVWDVAWGGVGWGCRART